VNKKDNSLQYIFEDQTRSDELLGLRETINKLSHVRDLVGNAIQLRVVIDTNVVLKDLIFLSKNAKKADVRTSLIEVIEAGTIQPYAPTWLCTEVELHIPAIAKKKNIDLESIRAHWVQYKKKIKFIEIDIEKIAEYDDSNDPKDAPFVILEEQLGAFGVLSDDDDIEKIGGNRIPLDVLISLRDYSRHASVELKIKYMGVVSGFITIALITKIVNGISGLVKRAGNLPKPILYAAIGFSIWVVLDPKKKSKVMQKFNSLSETISPVLSGLGELITELAALSLEHAKKAREHKEIVNQSVIRPE